MNMNQKNSIQIIEDFDTMSIDDQKEHLSIK